jgi:hypothetical protein
VLMALSGLVVAKRRGKAARKGFEVVREWKA